MNEQNNLEHKNKTNLALPSVTQLKNNALPLQDNRHGALVQKKGITKSSSGYSFQMPVKAAAHTDAPVIQKVDIGPHYCQQNNEWYAVDMHNACFQHFAANQHQNVIAACTATLAAHANLDWTTFNQTALQHNGWNFICTWVDNHQHRYLNVYHADHGYKDHKGKKEESREKDKEDRFKKGPPKNPFGKQDPSAMSAEDIGSLLDL